MLDRVDFGSAEVSRSLDGVRVVSVVDREAELFAEQRASPEVELLGVRSRIGC